MRSVRFVTDQYIWTGVGCPGDAISVEKGQWGIVLATAERTYNHLYTASTAYIVLLNDGRVAWTPFYRDLMEWIKEEDE